MYSYATRDVVVSKRFSARWATNEFPEWAVLIESARNVYDRKATAADEQALDSLVNRFYTFACAQIEQSKLERGLENNGEGYVE